MVRVFVLLALFSVSLELSAEPKVEVFTRADNMSRSNALPFKSYLNGLKGAPPKVGGTYFLTRNKIEFGMAWNDWELSLFHRNDYNLNFDYYTIIYSYKKKNQLLIPETDYEAFVKANQYQLTGLKLGREFDVFDGVKIAVGGSYFFATEALYGYLGGKEKDSTSSVTRTRIFIPPSSSRIDLLGDVHTDYYFTDDPLFRYEVDAPIGQGYSIDLGASWQVKENLLLTLRVDDALGAIYWDDLAHIEAAGTSKVFVEVDGLFESTPAFDGALTRRNFTQSLTMRSRFNVHYDLNDYYMGYEYDDLGLGSFHRITGGYQFNKDWGARVGVDIGHDAKEFTLIAPLGQFKLMFDTLDLDNAYNLGFSWLMRFPIN